MSRVFFTAIHEAGHGWMALLDDPNQRVQLDILAKGDTHEGWCESDWSSPRQLMAGMAAELVFGNGWHTAVSGSAGDRKMARQYFKDSDWRSALKEAVNLLDRKRHEVAAIALLLFQYRTLTQDECLECMQDPLRALQDHAGRLEACRLMDESISLEVTQEPWCRDLTLDGLPEAVGRTPPPLERPGGRRERGIGDIPWLWR